MIAFLGALFTFINLVLEEIFRARATAKAANEAYNLDKKAVFAAFEVAMITIRAQAKKDADAARDVEDRIDHEDH